MKSSRFEQLETLSGAVSVGLLILAVVLVGIYDYLPPADRVADFLSANSTRVMTGGYLGALGAFFLVWFAGSLRSALREREGAPGRLSEVAFGGGVAAGVALVTGFATLTIAAERAGVGGGISAEGAVTLYDLWSGIAGLVLPISLAVLVGAAAVVSLRRAMFPAWFGWVSAVVALASLSPVGYLGQILAVVWVLAVSVWLYAWGASSTAPSAVREAGTETT